MENSTPYTTQKDGFKITINKSDTELTIEAQDQENGNTFLGKFTDGMIKSTSLELFEDIPELFDGLLTAFNGLSKDPTVRVDPSGAIIFTQKLIIGKHEKLLKFPIPLKTAQEASANRIEEFMKTILQEVEGLKSEVSKLRNENQQLQNKLNIDYYEVIRPEIQVPDAFASKFELSEDKKTIALVESIPDFKDLFLLGTMLPREKSSKFRVKIQRFSGSAFELTIGITALKDPMENNDRSPRGVYGLTYPNHIYQNGRGSSIIEGTRLTEGGIVSVHYTPSRNEVRFEVDCKPVFMTIIDEEYQKFDVFPFINILWKGTKLSFI